MKLIALYFSLLAGTVSFGQVWTSGTSNTIWTAANVVVGKSTFTTGFPNGLELYNRNLTWSSVDLDRRFTMGIAQYGTDKKWYLTPANSSGAWDWSKEFGLQTDGVLYKRCNGLATEKVFMVWDIAGNRDVYRIMGDGKVWCTEVNVRLAANFPDYVFSDNYKPLTIGQIKESISKERKLPWFKDAAHYESNGMAVSDIIVKQQEALENMMLYIIELEKRLSKLEEK